MERTYINSDKAQRKKGPRVNDLVKWTVGGGTNIQNK